MINFTGNTKKRVVNLGNKKSNDATNYLEKTRLQRQQREEQRQRERSSLVIQSYIRRYIDLSKQYEIWRQEWTDEMRHWKSEEDWCKWISKFLFLCRWGRSRHNLDITCRQLALFYEGLNRNCLISKYEINSCLYDLLIKNLINLISALNRSKKSTGCISIICDCMSMLISKYSTTTHRYTNLILYLSDSLLKLDVPDETANKMIQLMFDININDSYKHFIEFLSIPNIFHSINAKGNQYLLDVLRKQIPIDNSTNILSPLANLQKINLLVNILKIHGDCKFIASDYIVIGMVLSTISFSIKDRTNLDEDGIDEDELERTDIFVDSNTHRSTEAIIPVSKEVIERLQVLYSASFIKQAIEYFTNANDSLSQLALHIFATLTYLIPVSKSKLCILITITPGSYKWFYHQLRKDPIYKYIEQKSVQNYDYLRSDDLIQLYSKIPVNLVSNFWKTLYTFEELYSYWLIVSNDLESFSEDKLSLQEVSKFIEFLKTICLTLIFNGNNSNLFNEFAKLKEISISLLNQLYSKNSRLKFLPDTFWKPNELNFNIDNMLQLIIDEEERRQEMEVDLLDNDSDLELNGDDLTHVGSSKKPKFAKANSDTLSKLEVLKKLPYFISFKDRVKVLQTLIQIDREKLMGPDTFSFFQAPKRLKADIRRESLFEDAFNSFHKCGSDFKHTLSVTLFNEQGGQEAGIDGGGITKEFLTSVAMEGFHPQGKFELFKETAENQLYPSDEIYKMLSKKLNIQEQQQKLMYLRFLGNIIGKCFYENVLIDLSFAPFFLNKWCSFNRGQNSMKNSINDLNYLDRELFKNLMKLTSMDSKELEQLDLNFTIDEKINDLNCTFDLLPPNGAEIKVDQSNILNYIHQISNFRLNQSLHVQTKFFLNGLFEIISSSWLSMFDAYELQMLISGGENDVNIQDWKENVEYGGYFDDDITVVYFWEVISEMNPEERFKLIKFVTSVSRAPLLGFGSLNPKFGIRNAGRSIDRLPTASTCVNLLKLPDYQDKELVRSKLLYAINTEARFDLS
ncbi:uncharacterized protein AC631_02252 [Debaryomyces fabryi]|uniref:HECT-type E3 ubiquitin transferase n=1 Tax=Debaryomyces fabryi TaxID=58627 RepID=A0A0V1Q0H5_9ASCO|nr:uncharacterized protein AC631_02252 [Debaryomyces fabryi]KSA01961.1 hypothetical protein AC631_02252 [Debaryomyces fabryi]CUM54551.1 unnamed protein product [Debaryomyces fabryi]